jgi:hypothetical protein
MLFLFLDTLHIIYINISPPIPAIKNNVYLFDFPFA